MQKVYRLSNNASFNYIYRRGSSAKSALLVVIFVKANNTKVGISVSKKVGNSVVRSLVKRRIKESFRLMIPALTVKANYVVVARESSATASYHQIDTELRRLLVKIGHLAENK